MSRRIFSLLVCLLLLVGAAAQAALFGLNQPDSHVTYVPRAEGASTVAEPGGSLPFRRRAVDRVQIMRDRFDRPVWKLTLRGTFEYNGVTVRAISSECIQEVYDPDWTCHATNAFCSGDQAVAEAVFEKEWMGIATLVKRPEIRITCNPDGTME